MSCERQGPDVPGVARLLAESETKLSASTTMEQRTGTSRSSLWTLKPRFDPAAGSREWNTAPLRTIRREGDA